MIIQCKNLFNLLAVGNFMASIISDHSSIMFGVLPKDRNKSSRRLLKRIDGSICKATRIMARGRNSTIGKKLIFFFK